MSASHADSEAVGGPLVTPPVIALGLVAAAGLAVVAYRFVFGLGAVSALSDAYPWGPWKAFSVIVLTAFASGGYAVAMLVYALNRKVYHSISRTAILTSAMGYTAGVITLGIDIGRPWNFWRLIIVTGWNLHSVLLEVAVCISVYIIFLWLEMAPPLMEGWKTGSPGTLRRLALEWTPKLDKAMPYIVAMAIVLPSMHQSSLGSLMLLAGPRLHPYWQTPMIPLLFLLSCWVLGYAFVVIASLLSSLAWNRPVEMVPLSGLSRIAAWITFAFLAIRVGDLAARGQFSAVPGGFTLLLLAESLLLLVPALFLSGANSKTSPSQLFRWAAVLLVGGGLYRLDTALIAFLPGGEFSYFPTVAEMLVTFGFTSLAIIGYIVIVKRFPILPARDLRAHA